MISTSLEILGLISGVMGQLLSLIEPVKLRHGYGGIEVFTDGIENYKKRVWIRRVGVGLTAIGFLLQLIAILSLTYL